MQLPMTDCPEAEGIAAAERTAGCGGLVVLSFVVSSSSPPFAWQLRNLIAHCVHPSLPPSLPPFLPNEWMDGRMDEFLLVFDDNTEQTTTARGTTGQDRTGQGGRSPWVHRTAAPALPSSHPVQQKKKKKKKKWCSVFAVLPSPMARKFVVDCYHHRRRGEVEEEEEEEKEEEEEGTRTDR